MHLLRPRSARPAWSLLFFGTTVTLAWLAATALAQDLIRTSSELVKLDVSVLDRGGHFAGGLQRSDFRVLDNGVEKPVLYFSPVEAPERVLILVETGPAVYLIHEQHMLALASLLDGLGPDDEAALVTYDDSPRNFLGFTAHKRALLEALSEAQFRIGAGDLNFYDSLSTVLDSLADSPGKKTIVLLTTGLDSSLPSRWGALKNRLRWDDVVIYCVGLGGSLRDTTPDQPKGKKHKHEPKDAPPANSLGETAFARANTALLSIAQITGGRTYFPQADTDFPPAYAEIAAAIRHEYVLGISPDHDGQYHSLTVQVLDRRGHPPESSEGPPDFRPFFREGYLAPAR
jgi:VWFA-related protein